MANDLNQCSFIGRLGADPETRFLPSGDGVTNFRIASGWKTKDKEGTEWVSIVAFGKLADICQQYLKKGSQVFVQGRMQTRKWQDKEGNDRYSTEIVADRMQMLGGKRDEAPKSEGTPAAKGGNTFDEMSDDIPF